MLAGQSHGLRKSDPQSNPSDIDQHVAQARIALRKEHLQEFAADSDGASDTKHQAGPAFHRAEDPVEERSENRKQKQVDVLFGHEMDQRPIFRLPAAQVKWFSDHRLKGRIGPMPGPAGRRKGDQAQPKQDH